MSLNGDLTVPNNGYIISDTSGGVINLGKAGQTININGTPLFTNDISGINITDLRVQNIKSFSDFDLDQNDPNQNINISSYVVNIGTNQNANIINIGNPLSTVNILGTTTYTYTDVIQQTLNSPLLELNKAYADISNNYMYGNNAGIQIDSISGPGYIKTNNFGTRYLIKAPQINNIEYIATMDMSNNMTVPGNINGLSGLNISGMSVLNKLSLGNISDVEYTINNKVDPSVLSSYYTINDIDNMNLLNTITASSIFLSITAQSTITTLSVIDTSTLVGNVTALSNLSVGGRATVRESLVVSGNMIGLGGIASISSFSVMGKSRLMNDLSVGGNVIISGTLNCVGTTSIESINIGGDLAVTGNTRFASNLNVSGITNLKSDVIISGLTTLQMANAITVNSSIINIDELATITGVLNVVGNSNFNTINVNSLKVTGTSNINTLNVTGLNVNGISNLQTLNVNGINVNDIIVNNSSNLQTLNVDGSSNLQTLNVYESSNLFSNLSVSGHTTLRSLNVTGTTNLLSNLIVYDNIYVSGTSNLGYINVANTINVSGNTNLNNVTVNNAILQNTNTYSLNVTGTTKLFGNLSVTGTSVMNNLTVTGTTNLQYLNLGYINNVEATVNNKVDNVTLTSYLTKMDAASTYVQITSITPLNVNGYDFTIYNFNTFATTTTILGSEWLNGYIGLGQTNDLTITLPSAYEVVNTTLSQIAPIGACFHTYMNYQLGTGRYNIQLNANNISSTTYLYDGYGFSNPTTDSLLIRVTTDNAPYFSKYSTHFITRIDNLTTMSIFKVN